MIFFAGTIRSRNIFCVGHFWLTFFHFWSWSMKFGLSIKHLSHFSLILSQFSMNLSQNRSLPETIWSWSFLIDCWSFVINFWSALNWWLMIMTPVIVRSGLMSMSSLHSSNSGDALCVQCNLHYPLCMHIYLPGNLRLSGLHIAGPLS